MTPYTIDRNFMNKDLVVTNNVRSSLRTVIV